MTTNEAAVALGVHPHYVGKLCRTGKLKAINRGRGPGRGLEIDATSVDALRLARMRNQSTEVRRAYSIEVDTDTHAALLSMPTNTVREILRNATENELSK